MKGHKFFIHKVETGFPRMPQLSKKNSINICCAVQRVLEQRIRARIKIKEGVNTGRKFQNPIMLFFVSNGNEVVLRYNVRGFVEELPQLPEDRFRHACAALPDTGVRPAQSTL